MDGIFDFLSSMACLEELVVSLASLINSSSIVGAFLSIEYLGHLIRSKCRFDTESSALHVPNVEALCLEMIPVIDDRNGWLDCILLSTTSFPIFENLN